MLNNETFMWKHRILCGSKTRFVQISTKLFSLSVFGWNNHWNVWRHVSMLFVVSFMSMFSRTYKDRETYSSLSFSIFYHFSFQQTGCVLTRNFKTSVFIISNLSKTSFNLFFPSVSALVFRFPRTFSMGTFLIVDTISLPKKKEVSASGRQVYTYLY